MNITRWVLLGVLICGYLGPAQYVFAQNDNGLDQRIEKLERKVSLNNSRINTSGGVAGLSFLFGAFCALWAQNTNRNSWLWFFLGLFFTIITVLFLLSKNSLDKQSRLGR